MLPKSSLTYYPYPYTLYLWPNLLLSGQVSPVR